MSQTPKDAANPDRAPAKRYTEQQKREGLIAVLFAGSVNAAAEQLNIPRRTLAYWRDSNPDMWAEVRREHGPQADQTIVANLREHALAAATAKRQLLERLTKEHQNIETREIPNAIKALTDTETKSIDRILTLTGRPNTIVEHHDARELIQDIARMFDPNTINSTATEDTTPEDNTKPDA